MEDMIATHVLWEVSSTLTLALHKCSRLFQGCTEDEMENAREGLEKLLMTRIHSRCVGSNLAPT